MLISLAYLILRRAFLNWSRSGFDQMPSRKSRSWCSATSSPFCGEPVVPP